MTRIVAAATLAALIPLTATADTFRLEMVTSDRTVLATMSQEDEGYRTRDVDDDYMQVQTDAVTFRIHGRFDTPEDSANLALIRNNTFIQFEHPELGAISCSASEDIDQPGSWTRQIVAENEVAGMLYYQLHGCSDEMGAALDVPGLPFTVQGTYILER